MELHYNIALHFTFSGLQSQNAGDREGEGRKVICLNLTSSKMLMALFTGGMEKSIRD